MKALKCIINFPLCLPGFLLVVNKVILNDQLCQLWMGDSIVCVLQIVVEGMRGLVFLLIHAFKGNVCQICLLHFCCHVVGVLHL